MTVQEARPPARRAPAVVLAATGRSVSHEVLSDRAARLADLLWTVGLRHGDTVALIPGDSVEDLELASAARGSGVVLLPLDPTLSLEEMAYVLNDARARALVVSAYRGDVAVALQGLTPYVEARFVLQGELPGHRPLAVARSAVSRVDASGTPEGTLHYTVVATGRPTSLRVPDAVADADGRRDVEAALGDVAIGPETVLLTGVPLSDPMSAQLVTAVHAHGGTVVRPCTSEAADVLRAMVEHEATLVHASPQQLVGLAKLPQRMWHGQQVRALRRVVLSVPGCPSPVVQALRAAWGPVLRQVYRGAGARVVAAADTDDMVLHPTSVGRVLDGAARVRDAEGMLAQTGVPGEIEVFMPSGGRDHGAAHGSWCTWGRRGYVDDQGRLHVLDIDGSILDADGQRVTPRELEMALVSHPWVADAAVLAWSELGVRSLLVYVQPGPSATAGPALEQELVEYLSEQVGPVPLPRGVHFVPSLPRTATGKLDRRRLLPLGPAGSIV